MFFRVEPMIMTKTKIENIGTKERRVMATIATPRKRARFNRKTLLWVGVPLILVLVCAAAGLLIRNAMSAAAVAGATAGWQTETVKTGSIDAAVSATGDVQPRAQADLRFAVDGTVTQILVKPGDKVQAGQPLARLDDADLKLQLEKVQADLKQAQADEQDLMRGATPQEIAEAKARVAQAQGQYQQTAGHVTKADIAAARAKLDAAQARLAAILSGHTDVSDAEMALQQAQTQLASKRDQLSAAKTNAQLQMQQRVNDLTEAQADYATAKRNWDYVQETGKDPNAVLDPKTGKKVHLKLDDRQKQQYQDAYIQAQAAMHSAETAVQQAQVAFDTARQAEVSGIQAAEQQRASAQANYDKLRAGADADELAAARAQLASSRAGLNKLDGEQRSGALAAAQASVDQAQANLDKLRAGASKNELAAAAAEVQSAEAALQLAQVAVAEAELRAPFAGTVAALDAQVGEYLAPGTPVVHVADLSAWRIETTDLTELNIVRVHEGSQAAVTFDAIPDLELSGTVSRIRGLGENKQGDITYVVMIKLDGQDPRLRWNMTASVTIAR